MKPRFQRILTDMVSINGIFHKREGGSEEERGRGKGEERKGGMEEISHKTE